MFLIVLLPSGISSFLIISQTFLLSISCLFHKTCFHCGSDRLEKTAKIHGFKLIGEFNTCGECAISKARQKKVKKEWKGGSQIPGERLYIDISSIKMQAMVVMIPMSSPRM
jgi:hypothetical protein